MTDKPISKAEFLEFLDGSFEQAKCNWRVSYKAGDEAEKIFSGGQENAIRKVIEKAQSLTDTKELEDKLAEYENRMERLVTLLRKRIDYDYVVDQLCLPQEIEDEWQEWLFECLKEYSKNTGDK
jgi:hypothetical protein